MISIGHSHARARGVAAHRAQRTQDLVVERAAEHVAERTAAGQPLSQPVAELGDGEGRVGAETLERALDAGAQAVPSLGLRVSGTDEERVGLVGGRVQHRDGIGLGEAGQEVEVGILTEGVGDVVVAGLLSPGRDDRDGLTQLSQQRRTSVGEIGRCSCP